MHRSFLRALSSALTLTLGTLTLLPTTANAQDGGFQSGDLYLLTPTFTGISSTDAALLRVDPFGGGVSEVVDLGAVPSSPGLLAYDPFRDRLLMFAGLVPNAADLYECDAAGNLTSLGFSSGVSFRTLAPRGDGLVYLVDAVSSSLRYLDAADQLHPLMEATGTSSYSFPVSPENIRRMVYHAPTNALFCLTTSNIVPCPGGGNLNLNLRRLTLSGDGTRVLSEDCAEYDITTDLESEVAVGLSHGPDGDLLVCGSINNTGPYTLLGRVDPESLASASFATPDYFGSNAPTTAAYSQALDRAVVVNGFGKDLRLFAEGELGPGATLATGSGSGGAATTLVEIAPSAPLYGLSTDIDAISLSAGGTQGFTLDLGPAFAGDTYFVAGSVSGWTPGFGLGALAVPLNPDGYFEFTVNKPNTGPLVATLGVLDAAGRASAALALPAGTTPTLIGTQAHHAALILGAGLSLKTVTNAVPLTLLP